jgi:hypothetical protein
MLFQKIKVFALQQYYEQHASRRLCPRNGAADLVVASATSGCLHVDAREYKRQLSSTISIWLLLSWHPPLIVPDSSCFIQMADHLRPNKAA